jgi:hypothetical protein
VAKKAKPKGSKAKPIGPYLAAAFFCENYHEDQDKVLSAFRMVDSIVIEVPPASQPPQALFVNVIVTLKFGSGNHELTFRPTSPQGERLASMKMPFSFPRDPSGMSSFNAVGPLPFPFKGAGIYWIDVLYDNKLLTRMPLLVKLASTTKK